jgi:hypothetical protein
MLVLVAGRETLPNLPLLNQLHLVWYPKSGEIMLRHGSYAWTPADPQMFIDRYINPATNLPLE